MRRDEKMKKRVDVSCPPSNESFFAKQLKSSLSFTQSIVSDYNKTIVKNSMLKQTVTLSPSEGKSD